MQPKEINSLLAGKIHEVCSILFPQGKVVANNYEVGSINGESGQSMKISLSGNNLGGFKDFASDESGDLIEMWMLGKGLSFPEAMKEIKSFLGILDDYSGHIGKLTQSNRTPKKLPVLPKYDLIDQNPKWCKFLDKRKISPHTAKAFNIGVYKDKLFFPHYFDGKPLMYHTRDYKKDENGAYIKKDGKLIKDFQTNSNPLYCLWGWDGIKNSDRYVVITEGRIDALSYIEQEIPAMSVPCGGGKGGKQDWINFDYHNLIDHFDNIYLSMDKDSIGQEALTEIINRLGDHLCWIIDLPNGCKDANDAHISGVDLKKCLKSAKQNTPEGLHRAGEFYNDIIEYFYPDYSTDKSIFLPWIGTKKYKARMGEVTIIAGENGSGKTQVVGHIALGCFEQNQIVGIASMEMSPKMLLGRLTRQATTNTQPPEEYIQVVSNYFNEWMWIYKKKGTADKNIILKSFLYLNKRFGVKYFIIDSLAKCGINEDDYNGQKDFVDELEAFADDNQCHIFLVHHLRKSSSNDSFKMASKNDVKGSGSIIDMIDNLILIHRNRAKEEFLENEVTIFETEKEENKYKKKVEQMKQKSDMTLIMSKQRNGDWEGKVPLWFDKNSYQFLDAPTASPYRFVQYRKPAENYYEKSD